MKRGGLRFSSYLRLRRASIYLIERKLVSNVFHKYGVC